MTEPRAKPVILLVDDEPLFVLELKESLVEAGYEALSAHSADQAIKLLDSHPDIRLVVTDINMPGSTNGYGLIRVVQARWPPVKLIILCQKSSLAPGLPPKDVHVLSKPLIFAHLDAIIRQLLQMTLPTDWPRLVR